MLAPGLPATAAEGTAVDALLLLPPAVLLPPSRRRLTLKPSTLGTPDRSAAAASAPQAPSHSRPLTSSSRSSPTCAVHITSIRHVAAWFKQRGVTSAQLCQLTQPPFTLTFECHVHVPCRLKHRKHLLLKHSSTWRLSSDLCSLQNNTARNELLLCWCAVHRDNLNTTTGLLQCST